MLSYIFIFGSVMLLSGARVLSVGDFLGFNYAFTIFSLAVLWQVTQRPGGELVSRSTWVDS